MSDEVQEIAGQTAIVRWKPPARPFPTIGQNQPNDRFVKERAVWSYFATEATRISIHA
ncbi:MAG: hypothetical protein H7X75_04790 [Burkholderiaceae bacterium]|nr:hypothetical protein [Burkholderiaceae bacterium]